MFGETAQCLKDITHITAGSHIPEGDVQFLANQKIKTVAELDADAALSCELKRKISPAVGVLQAS